MKMSLQLSFGFLIAVLLRPTPSYGLGEYVQDHKINAVVYHQRSSEYRALCYQAYNSAKQSLEKALSISGFGDQKPAVVLDVDETVLSNAPYEAKLIVENKSYPYSFEEWMTAAIGPAVPGAIEFINYAHQQGVKLFYVTNRKQSQLAGTVQNLKNLGLPDISEETVLMKTDSNSKEARRQLIRRNYNILLLIGDNLLDLAQEFEIAESAVKLKKVDEMKPQFGGSLIVIPNAIYGDWEGVYGDLKGLPETEKRARRIDTLLPYQLK